ncbi:hypothetical protein ACOME3_007024 [Neoechinorhynchus agilis]
MNTPSLLTTLLVILFTTPLIHGIHMNLEQKLIKQLLEAYPTKYARPVVNADKVIKVNMSLQIVQLLQLDGRTQTLHTNVWFNLEWYDEFLRWDPKNYRDLEAVRVPSSEIWMPDIVLQNYADERINDKRDLRVVVYSDGSILYVPSTVLQSVCYVDTLLFPYDQHKCDLNFRSWVYDTNKLDLHLKFNSVDMTDYTTSNEWTIKDVPAKRSFVTVNEDNRNQTYVMVTYTVIIQRAGGLFKYILLLPCLLLSIGSTVLFWIPPENPSKLILAMNIFTNFFVLLLLLGETLPQASKNMPKIGIYYCYNMISMVVTLMAMALVTHIYVRSDRRGYPPPFVRKLFFGPLARLTSVKAPTSSSKNMQSVSEEPLSPTEGICMRQIELIKERFRSKNENRHSVARFSTFSHEFQTIKNDLDEICDYLRNAQRKAERIAERSKIAQEWKTIALILDRILFLVYLIAFSFSMVVLYPYDTNSRPTQRIRN